MIDLTPLDVKKKRGDFRQKLRGYDPDEVNTFLELVEDRMEELVRENLSFTEKIQHLESRLEMLEGRETAVQEALVSAQKLREEVQNQTLKDAEALEEQSRREVELFRKEAEAEIEESFLAAQDILRERQRALEELERNRQKFLKGFRALLERELDGVEVEEARRPLEEAPLDLKLRGWINKREGGSDPSEGEKAGEGESASGDEGVAGEDPSEEGANSDDGADPGTEEGQGTEPLWLSSLLENGDGEDEEG